jgi:hypothetical protein
MLINRNNLIIIYKLINEISDKVKNIGTQYKFLKLKKLSLEEYDIFQQQYNTILQYAQTDDTGHIITNDNGGILMKKDKTDEYQKLLKEFNDFEIQIPDIYFSLDELEPLNLTFDELELLMPFIKE